MPEYTSCNLHLQWHCPRMSCPICRWVISFRRVVVAWSVITARRAFLHLDFGWLSVCAKLTTGGYGMWSQVCVGTKHQSQPHCRASEGKSHDACVPKCRVHSKNSRREAPLTDTFLSRTGCCGRLIARPWLITLFLQIFFRRSLSRHSDLLRFPAATASSAAENETRSALEGTANPIGVPQPSAAWESLRELASSVPVAIIVWVWTSQGS